MATTSSGSPLSVVDGAFVMDCVQGLDPKHKAPAREQRLDILLALDIVAKDELGRMTNDGCMRWERSFASFNSDFFTSKVLGASCGVTTMNVVAKKHQFGDGRWFFVSDETLQTIPNEKLRCKRGAMAMFEFCIELEQFEVVHASKSTGDWLHKNHNESGALLKH